ncbi:MAG TPA: VOC family protein [Stellaceae bacterium]|nr:VOC family protein [Stellaceae bacterium]
MPPLSAIDHVIVAVADLDRARLAWERLGFTLTPRGRHLQQGTGNYCIMFPRDYLELLGLVDAAQGSGSLGDFLSAGEGARGVAFATRSAEATAAALQQAGIAAGQPRDLARQLELPEGTVLPRFKLVSLPADATPGLHAFVCEQATPELVRRPSWLAHSNGAVGLRGIAVLVEATEPLRLPYERLFGAGVVTTDDVLTVHAGPHRLTFVTPDDFTALYPEADVDVDRALPRIAALTLGSRDLAQTADHLTQWQVAHEALADGTVLVQPAEANGALLIFKR